MTRQFAYSFINNGSICFGFVVNFYGMGQELFFLSTVRMGSRMDTQVVELH
jgi:hypothetical protein